MLRAFARGEDTSPVQHMDAKAAVKSVGNSTTTPRDLVDDTDVKVVFTVLAESVARRMREQGLQGRTVCISLRDKNLQTFTRRHKLAAATDVSTEIFAGGHGAVLCQLSLGRTLAQHWIVGDGL